MAADRQDMAYTVSENCGGMASPSRRGAEALQRLTCFLAERPRVVSTSVAAGAPHDKCVQ